MELISSALLALLITRFSICSPAGSCSIGMFGVNCTGVCHCLSSTCDSNDGTCPDYQCDRGWEGMPYCQTECHNQTFGSNCAKQCHCKIGDDCNTINGLCKSGLCDSEWAGTACQIRLPKLSLPPTVRNVTCKSLLVTWRPWDSAVDIGTPDIITAYSVEIRLNFSVEEFQNSTWKNIANVTTPNSYSDGYSYFQLNISDPYSYLEFRISTIWTDFGKPRFGLSSPVSSIIRPILICTVPFDYLSAAPSIGYTTVLTTDAITSNLILDPGKKTTLQSSTVQMSIPSTHLSVQTTSTLVQTTSTTVQTTTGINPPGPVSMLRMFLAGDFSNIYVNWSAPGNPIPLVLGYNVTFGVTGIGDCNSTTGQLNSVIINSTSYIIQNTEPWRKYGITVSAVNIAGTGETTNAEILSQQILPNKSITGVKSDVINSRSVTVSWNDVPCPDRGGLFGAYELTVHDLYVGMDILVVNSTMLSETVNNLTPHRQYAVSVCYINRVGKGPSSSGLIVTTASDVPPAPTNVRVSYASDTDCIVEWNAPFPSNGILQKYRVSFWISGRDNTIVQNIVNASQKSCNVTGLLPYTTYSVQVQAQTEADFNQGWGNSSDTISFQTSDGEPAAPANLQMTQRNESCFTIQWNPPIQINGKLTSYQVTCAAISVSDLGRQQQTLTSDEHQTTLCSLIPAVQYEVTIRASTTKGFGPPSTLNIWTELGQPDPPPRPLVISTGNTTITIRIDPVVLLNGPISGYFIVVSIITDANSRSRRSIPDPVKEFPLPGYTSAQLSLSDMTSRRNFIIGDGNTYGSYANKPLESHQVYTVYYVVASSLDGVTKMAFSQIVNPVETGTPELTSSNLQSTSSNYPTKFWSETSQVSVNPGFQNGELLSASDKITIAVVVPVLAIIITLIIVFVLIYFCWWSKRSTGEDLCANTTSLSGLRSFYISNIAGFENLASKSQKWKDIYSLEDPRYIVLSDAPKDIPVSDIHHNKPAISFEDEYKRLPTGSLFPSVEAMKDVNLAKNRFPHLLAYDHSSVRLTNPEGVSDYINANYIPGYNRRRKAYIAAQSPFSGSTICDFWSMIYSENICAIVFLAHLVENNIVKSEQYWPDVLGQLRLYGNVSVALINSETYSNFVIRTFQVSRDENNETHSQHKERLVRQYHFVAWPEHGVPLNSLPFLEFWQKVRIFLDDKSDTDQPCLVHCGTGVSRTAVFIAVDYCMMKAKEENCVNVYQCCSAMRQCRPMMVRTLKQYIFIYDVLFEALLTKNAVVGFNVNDAYHSLKKLNSNTHQSYFREEFQILEKYSMGANASSCTEGLKTSNECKNRFQTLHLIPADRDRVLLHQSIGPSTHIYINALFIDSYIHRRAFIVTQSPLSSTVVDFWRMISVYKVRCIVAMNGNDYQEESCSDYLPRHETAIKRSFENEFFVTLLTYEQKEHFTIRKLKLVRGDEDPQIILHFQFQSWKMYEQVPWSRDGFLQLIDNVEYTRNQDGHCLSSPIVVHCVDGASQSGLFCAGYVICEKMQRDNQVDIFHTIKQLKYHRFSFVNSLVQYRFCFKLLWDFSNTRLS